MKDIILATATDLARDFIYYDRKNDEDLPVESLHEEIEKGTVTFDEIAEVFKKELIRYYEQFK